MSRSAYFRSVAALALVLLLSPGCQSRQATDTEEAPQQSSEDPIPDQQETRQEAREADPAAGDRCLDVADKSLSKAQSWTDLRRWFEAYPDCDDGYLAEGASGHVSTFLAQRWQDLPALQQQIKENPGFEAFVLRHVDATADSDHLEAIIGNTERCPPGAEPLCSSIADEARRALADVRSLDIPQIQPEDLLHELPEEEGKALRAPYELWVATFGPDEGSYGNGPRVLIITNDLGPKQAIASIRGVRTELPHKRTKGDTACEHGATREEEFEAPGVVVRTKFTTSPGEEACWVEGTVTVVAGAETQTVRVKGVAGR